MLRILRRPRPPCGASSGAFGSCGPPAAHGGRLAADAAHRAAQSAHCYCSGSGGRCRRQMECESECVSVSPIRIGDIDIIDIIGYIDNFDNFDNIGNIGEIENYCQRERCVTLYGRSASILTIGDFETFHYSPLRGNFAAYLCERQWKALRCRALTSRYSVGGVREEESGVLRRLMSASGHQTPCTVKRLLCGGCAATEETTAADAAGY